MKLSVFRFALFCPIFEALLTSCTEFEPEPTEVVNLCERKRTAFFHHYDLSGEWYIINPEEGQSKRTLCDVVKFETLTPDSEYWNFKMTRKSLSTLKTTEFFLYPETLTNASDAIMTPLVVYGLHDDGENKPVTLFSVLAIDSNMAVVHFCRTDESSGSLEESLWVLIRTRNPDPLSLESLEAQFRLYPIPDIGSSRKAQMCEYKRSVTRDNNIPGPKNDLKSQREPVNGDEKTFLILTCMQFLREHGLFHLTEYCY